MSEIDQNGGHLSDSESRETSSEFEDLQIVCVDCDLEFTWSAGEQEFFRDKNLKNPPKRCKDCKKAKNFRIQSTANAAARGDLKIEVAVVCDNCSLETTVPFYPSQGRPVLCRNCFLSSK
jgi:CxxC-x17-CxxC domain-containing protein